MKEPKGEPLFLTPVSRRLVDLIERNAEELTNKYVNAVQRDSRMPTYGKLHAQEVYNRTYAVYSRLGRWISHETTREEIQQYWTALGRQRRREGFPFSEIILSLCYERRLLWDKVQAEGLLDTAIDLYQAAELNRRVLLFFDLALYYAAVGYEEQD